MTLKDKTIVITGATGGIASLLSTKLAQIGSKLILIARTKEKLERLRKDLDNKETHKVFSSDFSKPENLGILVDKIKDETKDIDILINAAGIGVYKSIEEVKLSEWQNSMDINVTAPFFLTKLLTPKELVLNLGSGMGVIPETGRSVYCATKFALRGMSLSLAKEFERTKTKIVHLTMGSTLTSFGPMTLEQKKEKSLRGKSYLTPEWLTDKIISLIENDDLEPEITLYPSDYKEER